MRWPWQKRRREAGDELSNEPAFDALIDLGPGDLATGVTQAAAVDTVVQAVGRLPGAAWISVKWHPRPGHLPFQVFPAGTSQELLQEPWPGIRSRVEVAIRQALANLRATSVPAKPVLARHPPPDAAHTSDELILPNPVSPVRRQGFSEAMSPVQMDALQQLALLATITKAPARPKAASKAPDANDIELLADLLGFVLPTGAHGTAATAVRQFGSFAAVLAAPEAELRRVPGLGTHCIAAIKLVHAAAVRLARANVTRQPVLDDWDRLAAHLSAALGRERIEQFRILFLDDHGMLRADELQATGTVNHTPVYPREVVRRALELGASSLVLVHNHPSGNPEPSREDVEMTRQVSEAATVMSIEVRDHVIVGNGRLLSFKAEGLLP